MLLLCSVNRAGSGYLGKAWQQGVAQAALFSFTDSK